MQNYHPDQLEELRQLCSALSVAEEGGITYILLEALQLPQGCLPEKVDSLLCPMPRDGYLSRLFFAEKITFPYAANANWNASDVRILERNWHAISWKVPRNDLRLAQILADHLNPHV